MHYGIDALTRMPAPATIAHGLDKLALLHLACCNLLGNVGTSDVFELTGVTSTTITLDHPTETISLDALAGKWIVMWWYPKASTPG